MTTRARQKAALSEHSEPVQDEPVQDEEITSPVHEAPAVLPYEVKDPDAMNEDQLVAERHALAMHIRENREVLTPVLARYCLKLASALGEVRDVRESFGL